MKMTATELINDLQHRTHEVIARGKKFKQADKRLLGQRTSPESWNILECLEHLNLYGDFYLKEIEKQILNAPDSKSVVFKSGWLGNYFALSMLPKNGKLNKMKTFKDKNPIRQKLDEKTIDRFLKQQERMLELLEQAKKVDLTRVKTAISISKFIKLRLGDTLRVVVYHNQRHIAQAEKVWQMLS